MKHLFIINPKAGKGKALELIPEIKAAFEDTKEEVIIEVTKSIGHATELVKSYVVKEEYRVYAVGGDGTLNEVLNGMVNSSSSLAVIPSGSGNDFIRSIMGEKLPKNIIKDAINGKEKEIDIAKVGGRYFLNISSIGIDAEVVDNAKNIKKIPLVSGKMAYVISAIITIFKYCFREVRLIIDDKELKIKNTLLAIANGKYYGGGMKAAPKADLYDGLLDICVVDKLNKLKMFIFFPKLIKGEHLELQEVSYYKCKRISVSSSEELTVNIDGEIIKRKNVDFEIIPKGIRFIVPNR